VGEGADDAAVGGAEAAGAVGDGPAGEQADEQPQEVGAGLADEGLAVACLLEEAGADGKVDLAAEDEFNEAPHL
jgi:hypothetical protein